MSALLLALLVSHHPIEVQGHRGARAVRPENTISAFKYALDLGVDVLEMDIAITKDNVAVVSHDPVLNASLCVDRQGHPAPEKPIRSLTRAQVQAFDCGRTQNPRFPRQQPVPGQRIPTLEQVLKLASAHPKVRLNIETKLVPGAPELTASPAQFVQSILPLLKKYRMAHRTTIQSFDTRSLRAFGAQAPEIERVVLVAESLHDPVAVARSVGARVYSCHHRWINKEAVKELHAAGIRVVPWTANKASDFERLIAYGVDGIITDDPAALLKYLGR